jgi:hypothetical protein
MNVLRHRINPETFVITANNSPNISKLTQAEFGVWKSEARTLGTYSRH